MLKKYKTVIFVHGCFWHKHENCKDAKIPKTNTEKWIEKIDKNKYRDIENERMLNSLGWNVIIIWECEVNKYQENPSVLLKKIKTKEKRPDNMER